MFLCKRMIGDLAQESENLLFVTSPLGIGIRQSQM